MDEYALDTLEEIDAERDAPLVDTASPVPAAPRPPAPLLRTPLPRALAYSACPTPAEYIEAHAADPDLLPLQRRLTEVRLPPADQSFFADYPEMLFMVAVVNLHLPDTLGVLPLWLRLAQACPRAELRLLGDDDPAALARLVGEEADGALDPAALELPALLLFDEEWRLQGQWGPRPQAAEPLIDEWLAQHPQYETLVEAEATAALTPADAQHLADLHLHLMLQMRIWYNSGLDAEGSAELRALLASLREETEPGDGV